MCVATQAGIALRDVMLCLPTIDHVSSTIFGIGGLLEDLPEGAIVIDRRSGDTAETRKMAAERVSRGIDMVDTPVSGGPDGAE